MIARGSGHPVVPMNLVGITGTNSCTHLKTEIADAQLPRIPERASKERGNVFQGRLNNFASFCQFMRSQTYRPVTLGILHADDRQFDITIQEEEAEIISSIPNDRRSVGTIYRESRRFVPT